MSDLSRLLDDVYGPSGSAGAPAPPAPAPGPTGLPDWALDSVLDDAFSEWVPAGGGTSGTAGAHVVGGSVEAHGTDGDPTGPVATRPWSRGDDDILPTRRGRGTKLAAPEELDLVTAPTASAPEAGQPDLVEAAPKRRFGRRRS